MITEQQKQAFKKSLDFMEKIYYKIMQNGVFVEVYTAIESDTPRIGIYSKSGGIIDIIFSDGEIVEVYTVIESDTPRIGIYSKSGGIIDIIFSDGEIIGVPEGDTQYNRNDATWEEFIKQVIKSLKHILRYKGLDELEDNNYVEEKVAVGSALAGVRSADGIRASVGKPIGMGDYVEFGRYYGDPILWKCVDNSNGVMLVSEYILCLKAFDAAESGKFGKGWSDAQKYGSSKWSDSNIREWLNSDSNRVSYSTQSPVKSALWEGKNAYTDEPGFLSGGNFSEAERSMIRAVNRDDETDRVFLLSFEELKLFGDNDGDRVRNITRNAVERSEYKVDYLTPNTTWWYWTSTPYAGDSCDVCDVGGVGSVGSRSAYVSYGGVVPALQLSSYLPIEGAGTKDEPWKF